MNQPLHLKYRPQSFRDLVGQPYVQTCLTNAIANDQIAPAYLFVGARGTGKTSTARLLAKSLNCLNDTEPTVTPCGTCQSCRQIETSRSLNVTEIDAASHSGVDDAREINQTVGLAPIQGRYRIVILDECHMLTTQAQNALLKCIEEPPDQVVFILCTTEAHKVLPTISSRCLSFEFKRIGQKTITDHLKAIAQTEHISITSDGFSALAKLCDGSLRDALQLLSKASLLGNEVTAHQIYELAGVVSESQLLGILQAIDKANVLSLLQSARNLIESGKSPRQIHTTLLKAYHDLLVLHQAPNQGSLLTSPVATKNLTPIAAGWSLTQIQQGLHVLHEAETQLRFSSNDQTWLEVTLLNLVPKFADTHEIQPISFLPVTNKSVNPTNGRQLPIDTKVLWQQVLKQATPKAQALLRRYAELTSFDGKTAVIVIDPDKETVISRNRDKIASLITTAAGSLTPVKLRIQVPTSIH